MDGNLESKDSEPIKLSKNFLNTTQVNTNPAYDSSTNERKKSFTTATTTSLASTASSTKQTHASLSEQHQPKLPPVQQQSLPIPPNNLKNNNDDDLGIVSSLKKFINEPVKSIIQPNINFIQNQAQDEVKVCHFLN
jgi:hypothetical protein